MRDGEGGWEGEGGRRGNIMESRIIPKCNGAVWHHSEGWSTGEKSSKDEMVWGPKSQCPGLPVPLRILAVIVSTVKSLVQPFVPAKSNLTQR